MEEPMQGNVNLDNVSRIVWEKCIQAKSNEKALIITDEHMMQISESLLKTGQEFCKCKIVKIENMKMHGEEPSKHIAEMMLNSDIVVAPTTFSITHTRASLNAAKSGARIVTMPGITKDMFLRTIPVDYDKLCESGERLVKEMSGKEINIETTAGTDMYLRVDGREFINSCGILYKGRIMNLPSGEVFVAPLEGKSEGKIIVDASSAPDSETEFGIIGRVKKPFKIVVEGGEMVDCDNDVLWKIVTSVESGTNLAELGIGTNPNAIVTGKILEDEKVLGTSHIAFGSNKDFGGIVQTSVHLDCVFRKPSITVDNKIVMKDGKF